MAACFRRRDDAGKIGPSCAHPRDSSLTAETWPTWRNDCQSPANQPQADVAKKHCFVAFWTFCKANASLG